MKIWMILFISILCSLSLISQSGKVTYKQVRQIEIHVEGISDELKNVLPSMNENIKELIFKDNQSLYQDITGEKTHNFTHPDAEGEANIQIKTKTPEEKVFVDFDQSVKILQKEIMGKVFLINDALTIPKWKILNEQKEILGYTCMKASTMKDDTTFIEAWFTPELTIQAGPDEYLGLPGLILETNQNNGEIVCIAEKIEMDGVEEILAPDKGEKVSPEKFAEIREKKLKEMREMYGAKNGNGVFIIRN